MVYKMAVTEWTLPGGALMAMRLAAQVGFEGIQLGDQGGSAAGYPLLMPEMQMAYRETAEELGLAIQAVHLHALTREGDMVFPAGTAKGDRAREAILNGCIACRELKSPVLMLAAFFASFIQNEWQYAAFRDHMRYACDVAEDMGLEVALESVMPLKMQLRMLDDLSGRFKIAYDNGNPLIFGSGDPAEEIEALGPERISFVHLKDKDETYEDGCFLGAGVCKVEETASALKKINWEGWLVNENFFHQFKQHRGENFAELVRDDLAWQKAIFS